MPHTKKKMHIPRWFNKILGRAKSVNLETPPLYVKDVYNSYDNDNHSLKNDSIELARKRIGKRSSTTGGKRKTKKTKNKKKIRNILKVKK